MALTLVIGVIAATLLWFSGSDAPSAQDTDEESSPVASTAPGAPTSAPPVLGPTQALEIRHEGKRYGFHERRYTPPYLLKLHPRMPDPEDLNTPEEALASLTSAMSHGDWDWWRQLWDREGRRVLADALTEAGKSHKDMLAGWRLVYTDARHVVTRRLDLPGYVLLYTQREDAAADAPEGRQPLALKEDKTGRWWFTHDLREHPLYFYDGDIRPALEATPR